MHWQVKATLQALLSRLPFGRVVYRTLQDTVGTRKLDIHDQFGMKAKFLKSVQEQKLSIADKIFLEVGTGWYPVLPILLYLLGVRETVTIDLNPWLTTASYRQTVEAFSLVIDRLQNEFQLHPDTTKQKLLQLLENSDGQPLSELLKRARIRYVMPCDATKTSLTDKYFDYLITSNVLEHMPPEVMDGMLSESKRILRIGGVHLHHVNPGDHFAIDSRITTVNFLRYSSRQWYWWGGSGIAYHNRWRGIDFVRLFERHGFHIIHTVSSIDQRALNTLQSGKLPVHHDFSKFTQEELAVDLIDIFARWDG